MKFNLFGGEKFSPEQKDITKQREAYDAQVKKDARKENTLIENLTNKGIDKTDIIHIDSKLEDTYREKTRKSLSNESSFTYNNELLTQLQKSTLIFDENTTNWYDGSNHFKTTFILEGLIAGKKVNIKGVTNNDNTWNLGHDTIQKISGSVDGKTISEQLAIDLLLKYKPVAQMRKAEIESVHEKIQEQEKERKEQEKFKKEEEEENKSQLKKIEAKKKINEEVSSIFGEDNILETPPIQDVAKKLIAKEISTGDSYQKFTYSDEVMKSPEVLEAAKKGFLLKLANGNTWRVSKIKEEFNFSNEFLESHEVKEAAMQGVLTLVSTGNYKSANEILEKELNLLDTKSHSPANPEIRKMGAACLLAMGEIARANEIIVADGFSGSEVMSIAYPKDMTPHDLTELFTKGEIGKRLCSSICRLTSFSYPDQIKPLMAAQGDSAPNFFNAVKKNQAFHNFTNDDTNYITYVGKKYGVQAQAIMENILAKSESISIEKDLIEEYIKEIGIYSYEVYQQYKKSKNEGDANEFEHLKESIVRLQKNIYNGKVTESDYHDNLFGHVMLYSFPPATGLTQDQYIRQYQNKPDRRADTPESLNSLQYEKVMIPTGRHALEGGVELDLRFWSELSEVVREVNDQQEIDNEIIINGSDVGEKIIEIYKNKKQNSAEGRKSLFREMYLYHLAHDGGKLDENFEISVTSLMNYKEFVGDRIKNDLIKSCVEAWRTEHQEDYNELKKDTINRMRQSDNQNLAKVLNMTEAIKRQNDEAKKIIAINKLNEFLQDFGLSYDHVKYMTQQEIQKELSSIKIDYAGELDKFNYQTDEYYNSKAFIEAYDELLGSHNQDEMVVQKISSDLVAEINRGMRKELQKFKVSSQEGSAEERTLELVISKKKEHSVAGFNMGVCVAPDAKLWNDNQFMNAIMLDPELKQAMGGMHFLIRENCLCLPGINPSLQILSQVDNEALFDKMIEYAKKAKVKLGLDKLLIPTKSSIHSNRTQIQQIINKKNYTKINLSKEAIFSYTPSYSFQECYEVV